MYNKHINYEIVTFVGHYIDFGYNKMGKYEFDSLNKVNLHIY